MPLGPAVRQHLGPLEQTAAALYRRLFFTLDCFTDRVLTAVPDATRILEVGCGDGDVATKLVAAYPGAGYVGIDPAPTAGRRYRGPARAAFLSTEVGQLTAQADRFDLILIVDVLHHVPDDADRAAIIRDAVTLLDEGGCLVVKEWERNGSLPYWAGWAADYYISGDRQVRYWSRDDLLDFMRRAAPELRHERTLSVHPWRCNALHVYRSTGNLR